MPTRPVTVKPCGVAGCPHAYYAKGLCYNHWQRNAYRRRKRQRPLFPEVKDALPRDRWASNGVGLATGSKGQPPAPTEALPGTANKLEVLVGRALEGVDLWHQTDGRPDLG